MSTTPAVADAGTDDEFEKAFAEFTGEPPPPPRAEADADGEAVGEGDELAPPVAAPTPAAPAASPAEAPVAAPAAAPAPAPAADSGLTYDELLKLVPDDKAEAARKLLDRSRDAEHRLASEVGRQAALQRLLHEQRERSAQLEAELAAARTPAETAAAQAKVETAQAQQQETEDALSKEFPELSGPLNMRIKQVVNELLPPQGSDPAAKPAHAPAPAAETQAETTDDPNVRYAAEYADIARAYPDWQTEVRSKEYQQWVQRQPAGVQAMGDSERVEDAIWLIGQFKKAKAEATASVREDVRGQLREHVAPKRNPGPRAEGAGRDSFENHFNSFVAASEVRRS